MASTSSRKTCSGWYHSSSSNSAPSTFGSPCRSTAFGISSSPVTPIKVCGQPFSASPYQNDMLMVDNAWNFSRLSISAKKSVTNGSSSNRKKYCTCSPSTHPGAFRCSLHRNVKKSHDDQQLRDQQSFNRSMELSLNLRRRALANSLLKIRVAEGRNLLKKASSPSQQKIRRATFKPRPSRLSRPSMADD